MCKLRLLPGRTRRRRLIVTGSISEYIGNGLITRTVILTKSQNAGSNGSPQRETCALVLSVRSLGLQSLKFCVERRLGLRVECNQYVVSSRICCGFLRSAGRGIL